MKIYWWDGESSEENAEQIIVETDEPDFVHPALLELTKRFWWDDEGQREAFILDHLCDEILWACEDPLARWCSDEPKPLTASSYYRLREQYVEATDRI